MVFPLFRRFSDGFPMVSFGFPTDGISFLWTLSLQGVDSDDSLSLRLLRVELVHTTWVTWVDGGYN